MDTQQTVIVPMSRIMRDATTTIEIVGVRTWRLRMRAAFWLMKLAGKLAGCEVGVAVRKGAEPE